MWIADLDMDEQKVIMIQSGHINSHLVFIILSTWSSQALEIPCKRNLITWEVSLPIVQPAIMYSLDNISETIDPVLVQFHMTLSNIDLVKVFCIMNMVS